jgi:hypothetical protein
VFKNTLGLHLDTKLTWENYVKNLQTQGMTKCPEEAGKKQLGQLKIHNEFYIYSTYRTHPTIWLCGTDNQNISCPQQIVIQNQGLGTCNRGSQINGTFTYAKCSLPYHNYWSQYKHQNPKGFQQRNETATTKVYSASSTGKIPVTALPFRLNQSRLLNNLLQEVKKEDANQPVMKSSVLETTHILNPNKMDFTSTQMGLSGTQMEMQVQKITATC